MPSVTFNVPFETDSSPRALFVDDSGTGDLDQRLQDWITNHGLACTFAIAELANPFRSEGRPVLIVAIDLDTSPNLSGLAGELGLSSITDFPDMQSQ